MSWLARQTREQDTLDANAFADEGAPIPRLEATVLYRVAADYVKLAFKLGLLQAPTG